MKKNDIIELIIDKTIFPGMGIGYADGVKVLVKNTLPGQKVQVRVGGRKSGGVVGRLLEVLEKSPLEQEPGCSHFSFCGGCTYQHLSYGEERSLKEKQVLELLEGAGITDFVYEGIQAAPVEKGYRNKCEFSFGDEEKDGDLALGMRKRQSHYEVVTLRDCNIVDSDYTTIIQGALDFFRKNQVSFYHKARHTGVLRHLVVRKGVATGEILINLITAEEGSFSRKDFVDTLLGLPLAGGICGILETRNTSVADVVKADSVDTLFGRDYFYEKLGNLTFLVSAFSFFQTNTLGAEKLYDMVKRFAGDAKDKVVFDLYCGTGTIGQIMASSANKVIGIELVEEAVIAANENAKRNGLTNCTFLQGDVLKKVEELEEKPDIIIVDPPREGIHPKAIGKIIDFGAPKIVYVSCKPTSLARDLVVFQEAGYQVERVGLMDMFPRTGHVETVVLMTKE